MVLIDLPFFGWDDLYYPASHTPVFDLIHILFEVLKLFHGWLEYGDTTRCEEVVVRVEPRPAI
jgi:hypothetical protein